MDGRAIEILSFPEKVPNFPSDRNLKKPLLLKFITKLLNYSGYSVLVIYVLLFTVLKPILLNKLSLRKDYLGFVLKKLSIFNQRISKHFTILPNVSYKKYKNGELKCYVDSQLQTDDYETNNIYLLEQQEKEEQELREKESQKSKVKHVTFETGNQEEDSDYNNNSNNKVFNPYKSNLILKNNNDSNYNKRFLKLDKIKKTLQIYNSDLINYSNFNELNPFKFQLNDLKNNIDLIYYDQNNLFKIPKYIRSSLQNSSNSNEDYHIDDELKGKNLTKVITNQIREMKGMFLSGQYR
ncbi:uncharacterized protein ASCRUDRAFT_88434 [Ascoidea rubescens DSM 1968]|uniref:Uncharacterized protein n=1 Tax=Ascoidea rubescens DSM 1968 TaxID=1344418 RepID=A0A1D2V9M0_9ASCO|nr:hypothetical protein ASCRUDRAFT_88434 [Ascoidea rubescens DSM 1968]ODV58324.1 hypothetical protein ASCRUDRAFT_88434 [Ascoidea rubescens DSM 1968]